MDEPVCPCSRDALKRAAELTHELEEAMCAGNRQPPPFRKGPPRPTPKTPAARKPGDAHDTHGHRASSPGSVTQCHQALPPGACPYCRGPQVGTGAAEEFHTEMLRPPARQFVIDLPRRSRRARPCQHHTPCLG